MEKVDLLVIGGGSAGMAAALQAKKEGIKDILILEKEDRLGGILNQCIHNGFGLHRFKEEFLISFIPLQKNSKLIFII